MNIVTLDMNMLLSNTTDKNSSNCAAGPAAAAEVEAGRLKTARSPTMMARPSAASSSLKPAARV